MNWFTVLLVKQTPQQFYPPGSDQAVGRWPVAVVPEQLLQSTVKAWEALLDQVCTYTGIGWGWTDAAGNVWTVQSQRL